MSEMTPMMQQYTRIKHEHRDAVLFVRLGDFYEMFQSDAREVSRILGLTLTSRHGVPMCGIPYHASHTYIARLLRAGKKIAVCEQVKMPENGKGLAERDVVEIITPGTAVDEDYLDSSSNNYLFAFGKYKDFLSYSYIDISTGEFCIGSSPFSQRKELLRREFARLSPREILIQESLLEEDETAAQIIGDREGLLVNRYPDWSFDLAAGARYIKEHYGVLNLAGFGLDDDSPELLTAGVILEYVADTAKNLLPHLRDIERRSSSDSVELDESTQRNLELLRNLNDGSKKYSLIHVLDQTKTSMGARLLKKWILNPLLDEQMILSRLQRVDALYHNQFILSKIRERLSSMLDIERLASKTALDKAHAKDLVAIRSSLEEAELLAEELSGIPVQIPVFPDLHNRQRLLETRNLLEKSICDTPSILLTEGNLIRSGYHDELDRLRSLRDNSRAVLEEYLEKERAETGIPSLKLKYNKILGYFLEVTKTHIEKIPAHFNRRQSLVNSERYTTETLSDLESRLNNATEQIIELEKTLFIEVRKTVKDRVGDLLFVSDYIAVCDCLQSFAYRATLSGYTMPSISSGRRLSIKDGRHPVVEAYLSVGEFIPNSIDIDTESTFFALITGPNMAGKSTYLRQTALIVLMAQIGSFVPASETHIGIVDKIFCRVGATDNLARGESTFLVEMNETANILRQAGPSSLIIMDEVGRGTSTNDGLAIAQAVSEHILDRLGTKTLFATHFHELTRMNHPSMLNLSLSIAEDKGKIIFLKKVVQRASNNSYGIHVAQLAGIPQEVIDRAKEILSDMEPAGTVQEAVRREKRRTQESQKDLFSHEQIIIEKIRSFDINNHSPVEALVFISRLREEIEAQKENDM